MLIWLAYVVDLCLFIRHRGVDIGLLSGSVTEKGDGCEKLVAC